MKRGDRDNLQHSTKKEMYTCVLQLKTNNTHAYTTSLCASPSTFTRTKAIDCSTCFRFIDAIKFVYSDLPSRKSFTLLRLLYIRLKDPSELIIPNEFTTIITRKSANTHISPCTCSSYMKHYMKCKKGHCKTMPSSYLCIMYLKN